MHPGDIGHLDEQHPWELQEGEVPREDAREEVIEGDIDAGWVHQP